MPNGKEVAQYNPALCKQIHRSTDEKIDAKHKVILDKLADLRKEQENNLSHCQQVVTQQLETRNEIMVKTHVQQAKSLLEAITNLSKNFDAITVELKSTNERINTIYRVLPDDLRGDLSEIDTRIDTVIEEREVILKREIIEDHKEEHKKNRLFRLRVYWTVGIIAALFVFASPLIIQFTKAVGTHIAKFDRIATHLELEDEEYPAPASGSENSWPIPEHSHE